jgi:bla regulator protein BlaR1
MIMSHLFAIWAAIAPALGNHLWQSTLFAITAGLLTLALGNNHARARYWLWLAASAKFLVPFSLLAEIGSHIPRSNSSAETAKVSLYSAMAEVSQPFTRPTIIVSAVGTPSTVSSILIHLLPALLAAVWLCGLAVVISVWYMRWRRISSALRKAKPLTKGREVDALRMLERTGGLRKRTEILLGAPYLEPGIFGISRPVLVWPEGISDRLEDAHLEAILAHELWHVRRRDNLAAAMHMIVETIFWFHPCVWWVGARMVEERERACDEYVVELGSERQVYAEGILRICEFCVGSRLACVSGVTGADLKKRIVRIMTERRMYRLDFSRKLLLTVAGLAVVATPVSFGLLNATQTRAESQNQDSYALAPVYEVTSVKPNKSSNPVRAIRATPDRLIVTNFTLFMLVRTAYGVQDFQISGGPTWFNADNYDIEAKMDSAIVDKMGKLSPGQRNIETLRMLQSLLVDRFKLSLHRETRELPVYALVIAKDGPKFHEARPGDTYPNGMMGPGGRPAGPGLAEPERGKLVGQAVSLSYLAEVLSGENLGRTVLNRTGLAGDYDFTLQWTPDQDRAPTSGHQSTDNASSSESTWPSIFTAIQEQLGLKLESQKGPIEVLVIDHAEKPLEN